MRRKELSQSRVKLALAQRKDLVHGLLPESLTLFPLPQSGETWLPHRVLKYTGPNSCEQGLRERARDTGCLPTSVKSVLGRDLGAREKGRGSPQEHGAGGGVFYFLGLQEQGLRLLPALLLEEDPFWKKNE